MSKQLNETASGGATSAGAIATVNGGLNYSLQRRMPPTTLFGVAENIMKTSNKDKKKK